MEIRYQEILELLKLEDQLKKQSREELCNPENRAVNRYNTLVEKYSKSIDIHQLIELVSSMNDDFQEEMNNRVERVRADLINSDRKLENIARIVQPYLPRG